MHVGFLSWLVLLESLGLWLCGLLLLLSEALVIYFLNFVRLLELLLHVLLLLLLSELLHVCSLVYWLETLELSIVIHANLLGELLLLLPRLIKACLVWVSLILTTILRLLLLLELHHLLLSLGFWLEGVRILHWLKALSLWFARNV